MFLSTTEQYLKAFHISRIVTFPMDALIGFMYSFIHSYIYIYQSIYIYLSIHVYLYLALLRTCLSSLFFYFKHL